MQNHTAPQGVNCPTFRAPPFKDFITLPELYDWHGVHSEDHPFFVYFDEASNTKVTIRWAEAVKILYFIANSVLNSVGGKRNDTTRPLVAFYSSADTLGYILSFVGIMRAGFPVFIISDRTSPAVLKHLIVKSGVSYIFVDDHDDALSKNLQEAKEVTGVDFTVARIPPWFNILTTGIPVNPPPVMSINSDPDSICLVLHSSGSTALPGLNFWTHKMVAPLIWQLWYGERDICGQVMSTPSIPMAGASGVMQAIFPASSGIVISGFQPTSPAIIPTVHNVWSCMLSTGCDYSFVLQPFLVNWSEDPHKINMLAELEGVMFCGGPLPRAVGNKLAGKGVEIFTLFGSSEAGLMSTVFPRKMGMDWEWFRFCLIMNPAFRPEPDENTVELILKTGIKHRPTKINTEIYGIPSYATGDLLEPHPTKPGFWRYVGRMADQETMGAGLKVDVVTFARILMIDPLITGAVLFNHTVRDSVVWGAIIEPDVAHDDLEGLSAYKDSIWPSFERYNRLAPDAGQIAKERIIVASKAKPFTYSEKGMPRRKEVIDMYHSEIQSLV